MCVRNFRKRNLEQLLITRSRMEFLLEGENNGIARWNAVIGQVDERLKSRTMKHRLSTSSRTGNDKKESKEAEVPCLKLRRTAARFIIIAAKMRKVEVKLSCRFVNMHFTFINCIVKAGETTNWLLRSLITISHNLRSMMSIVLHPNTQKHHTYKHRVALCVKGSDPWVALSD